MRHDPDLFCSAVPPLAEREARDAAELRAELRDAGRCALAGLAAAAVAIAAIAIAHHWSAIAAALTTIGSFNG